MGMIWDHSEPFPPDAGAPQSPSERGRRPWLVIEAPTAAVQVADALERELAQLQLIGPAAGAELRRLVHGGEQASVRLRTQALSGTSPTGADSERHAAAP
jgi:hypothetical protein